MNTNLKGIDPSELAMVSGGVAPLVAAAAALVSSEAFVKFTVAVSVIALAMEVTTEILES